MAGEGGEAGGAMQASAAGEKRANGKGSSTVSLQADAAGRTIPGDGTAIATVEFKSIALGGKAAIGHAAALSPSVTTAAGSKRVAGAATVETPWVATALGRVIPGIQSGDADITAIFQAAALGAKRTQGKASALAQFVATASCPSAALGPEVIRLTCPVCRTVQLLTPVATSISLACPITRTVRLKTPISE